ncbi:DNA (cytosine-5-)-methyltransferase [Acetobacter pomorum]|uniref:Cytosine-specific methyltransferase n=1 Tax=Acetobacter pomorum TaxID=65959 RepID=A0A2G4RDV8_9PROT|nr:DNA (cytosine-5-)-methyltransferase [Acetobacter pomorum]
MSVVALTAIDLFSGCGGLTCGLKQAGFQVVAAVELDKKAQETYTINHPEVSLYKTDIRELDAKRIRLENNLGKGELDLLAGCPPCQGFSRLRTKNKIKNINDERNNLIYDFLRFIEEFEPKSIMLENVPNLQYDKRFKYICLALKKMEYQIIFKVLDASDYLVPQRRKRLILLASKNFIPTISNANKQKISVRMAFSSLDAKILQRDLLHNMPEKRTEAVRQLIALIPKDGGSRVDLGEMWQLECHKKTKGFYDVYGRMAWDDVAPTITSGCSNPSKGRFLHPDLNRTITLREASILQGFPTDYYFNIKHGKQSIALMIGNALPPPFIKSHALSLKEGLLNRYKYSE